MSARFQYQSRPEDAWKKRGEQSGSQYAGYIKDQFKTFSAKKGENAIRILPPTWSPAKHYGMDIWVHFGVGPDGGSVLCLQKMRNQACPICETYAKAEAAGRQDADDFKPIRRVLVWLANRKSEKDKELPELWGMPWTVDRDIAKICKDRETGELFQIDHPDQGYDITFEKEGEQLKTKYIGFVISRRSTQVEDSYLEFVARNPVPDCLLWRTYDEVNAVFQGAAPPEQAPVSSVPPVDTPLYQTPLASAASVAVPATPPPAPAPAPVPIPVETVPQFCNNQVVSNGRFVGCIYISEHAGYPNNCSFGRDLGEAPPPPPPPPPMVPQAAPQVPQVPGTPSGSDRAAGLRAKFSTGGA